MRTKREIQTELLLLQCRRGDPDAFARLTRVWERRLLYYIRRIVATEEDAWDVLQEVWLRVWRKVSGIRETSSFRAWVYAVAHNSAISHARHETRVDELHESAPVPDADDSAPTFDNDDAARIHRALDRLGPQQRQVLTLFFLEEFSQAEIAEILAIPKGTVKSRLYHARQALRSALDGERQR